MGAVAPAAFVGRTSEREALEASLRQVASGRSVVVVVEGEAGIGKTRLLDEVLSGARRHDLTVLRSVARELERNRPFGVVADALGAELHAPDRERAEIAQLLWGRLDHPAAGVSEVVAGPGMRYRVLEALLSLVERSAVAGPVVLALEDLHWCDPSSLLTLDSLRRRLGHLPVALLLTRRPVPRTIELDHALDGVLADQGHRLVLGPLDDADVETLVGAVTGFPPGDTLRRELPRARGNPLFVIELLQALGHEHGLVIDEGRAELACPNLPARVHLMLLRRISYLTKPAMDLLRLASVLGPSFDVSDLALVARRPVVDLLPLLDEAIRAGALGDNGSRLIFRHDLIREAIYCDLAPALRAGLHREAGRALADAGAPAVQVAEHMALGASPGDGQAVRWLHEAALETISRAPDEAIALLERALDLAPPTDARRDAIVADLVIATLWAGRLPEAESTARAALGRGHDVAVDGTLRLALIMALLGQGRSGEATREAAAGFSQPGLPARAQAQLRAYAAHGPLFTGDLAAASAMADAACTEGERLGDVMAVSVALNALGMVATLQGRVDDGVRTATEALDRADGRPGSAGYRWHSNMTLAVSLMDADRFSEAEHVLGEGRRRCEDFGVRWPLPLYQWGAVWLAFRRGAWDVATTEAQAGFRLVDEVPFRFGAVSAHSAMAMVAVQRNELPAAESALAQARAELARTGPQYLFEWHLWAAALVEEATGPLAAAIGVLEEAWAILTATGALVGYAELGGDLVRLLILDGQVSRARAASEQVADVAARMQTPSAIGAALRCRGLADSDAGALLQAVEVLGGGPRPLALAQASEDAAGVLAAGGQVRDAGDLLRRAAHVYQRLGARRGLGRVEARLRALGMPPGQRGPRSRRPQVGWASLTSSETQVARLAVDGMTNREIAERLFVSPRTAETHLRHVFAKLGLTSRRELRRQAALRPPEAAAPPMPPTAPAAGPTTR